MKRHLSLTARSTALFAIVASIALAGLGGVTMVALDRYFAAQDRDLLLGKVQLVQELAARVDSDIDFAMLSAQLKDAFVGHHDLAVMVTARGGNPLFSSNQIEFPQALLSGASLSESIKLVKWESGGRQFRGVAVAVATHMQNIAPLTLALAINIDHHTAFLESFGSALIIYIVVAAVVSAALGGLAVRKGLMPLYAMKERASGVMAGQMNVRMPVEAVPIEMAELASTLNRMLDRLEDAFRRLSDFSSDIAHELRTPICNLMTQTQVALSQARTSAQYRDILASNVEEFERMARMVDDMLFLAKAEHGLMLPSRVEINLAHEVTTLFEFYEALAEQKHVRLQLTGSGAIRGDRLMIRRAVSNLLSNALRYTPAGQTIAVSIKNGADYNRLCVYNPGPGISPEALPHVFDRFYRAEKDRSHVQEDGGGAGLGLAIVQAVVTAHGGRTIVESGAQGTTFTLEFPQ